MAKLTKLTKTARQHRIVKLLEDNLVTNQAQVVELLEADGYEVNQATVSRDLEELAAVKVRLPGGDTAYAIPELPYERVTTDDHLKRVLGDWVAELDRSGDLVVLRTPPGCAHVVASALDRSALADILGTVAGDDTILVIATESSGPEVEAEIARLAGLA
ncbi:MAG: arginine repressor [Microthrixaceae bacterium]|nr:arginine repressor [Microthrixaceae bacterium]MCO5314216.1 arginine repressor [Microthrixaceae bacterium]HPB45829.1 arginine repressor [Microthrixaceae bacterium]